MRIFDEKHFVQIRGGLGNQFYLYAYADYLIKNGKKTKLFINNPKKIGNDSNDRTKRNIILDIPNRLNLHFANKLETFLLFNKHFSFILDIWRFFFLDIQPKSIFEFASFRPIDNAKFNSFNIHQNYYQSYHYISNDFRKKLSNIINNSCYNHKKYNIQPNDVALHIRRGDYLSHRHLFHIIDTDYYIKAIKKLKSKININNIYIFSDDFENIHQEIKEISKLANVMLVKDQSVLEDINTMRYFNHYILGNSTFAWWGAMLSSHDSPNVYVPKTPWKRIMPDASPYFPNWILIENNL